MCVVTWNCLCTPSGLCISMWCVIIKLVLLLLPRPVSWNMEVWAMCRECACVCVCVVSSVSIWAAHDLARWKSPICVSANNSWPLNAHPPEAQPTHLYSQDHTFPQRFLLPSFFLFPFLPWIQSSCHLSTVSKNSMQNLLKTNSMTAHVRMYKYMCMLMYTQGDEHETDV